MAAGYFPFKNSSKKVYDIVVVVVAAAIISNDGRQ